MVEGLRKGSDKIRCALNSSASSNDGKLLTAIWEQVENLL